MGGSYIQTLNRCKVESHSQLKLWQPLTLLLEMETGVRVSLRVLRFTAASGEVQESFPLGVAREMDNGGLFGFALPALL